jgi:hypothetical protein
MPLAHIVAAAVRVTEYCCAHYDGFYIAAINVAPDAPFSHKIA